MFQVYYSVLLFFWTNIRTHTKINGNNHRTLLFTDLDATDIIFTDIIIHAKVFRVQRESNVRDIYDQ